MSSGEHEMTVDMLAARKTPTAWVICSVDFARMRLGHYL